MAHEKVFNKEAIDAFWGHLKDRTTAMLGAVGGDRTQPMTAFAERENELAWFFTRNDTDLAQDAIGTTEARLIFGAKDEKLFADISGTLSVDHDRGRIEKHRNAVVAAWEGFSRPPARYSLLRKASARLHIYCVLWG